MTEQIIALNELHETAYHEAGHKAMCEHFGGTGDVVVWKNESGALNERAWRGQFRQRICPEQMHDVSTRAGLTAIHLPRNWKILVGMAGVVAEEIYLGETEPDIVAYNIMIRISHDDMSKTDLNLMNINDINDFENSYIHVEECISLLLQLWPLVKREAEYHIACATNAITS